MNKTFMIFLAFLMLSPTSFAHQLNEYLEATTINLSRGEISMELRLTPGVDVAATILKDIDINSDNVISAAEQRAYVEQLALDLSLTLDDRTTTLKTISYTFPTVEDMRKGTGDIIVEYVVNIGHKGSSHQLILKNNHHSSIAVYLVNCLLPQNKRIRVVNQTRNTDQSVYKLDFKIDSITPASDIDQQSIEEVNHWNFIKTYFVHGIRHILTGYDHLLFLCALVIGAAALWDLIKIVTAFTIAHSITLTLTTLGLAHLPEYIVEPFIAISIVSVAVQNIFWQKYAGGNGRLAVAFFFGLFHGLGFAGGLLELMHAMPPHTIFYAILGFSLGVEAGNQLVLLPLYGILRSAKRFQINTLRSTRPITLQQLASGVVAVAGIYYLCIALATNI